PLRPATRLCLGEPLPHQLADGPRAPPPAPACKQRPAFPPRSTDPDDVCGISHPFEWLSPPGRHVPHVLLTRPPHYSGPEGPVLARLACVKPAANVRSEPGSNSPLKMENPPRARPALRPNSPEPARLSSQETAFRLLKPVGFSLAIQFSKTDCRASGPM